MTAQSGDKDCAAWILVAVLSMSNSTYRSFFPGDIGGGGRGEGAGEVVPDGEAGVGERACKAAVVMGSLSVGSSAKM